MQEKEWKSSDFYAMPEISKCQEILEEIEKSNEIHIQMAPPNSLKELPIIAVPNSYNVLSYKFSHKKILIPLVPKPKSYIKGNCDILKKLPRNLDSVAYIPTFRTNLI